MSARKLAAAAAVVFILSGCGDDVTSPTPEALSAGPAPVSTLASEGANVNPGETSSFLYYDVWFVCTEAVEFTGQVTTWIHWADPPDPATTAETFHARTRFHGVRGIGLTSGDEYHLLGGDFGTFGPASFGTNGERITTVIKQQVIRKGTGKVGEITSFFHLVVNRNGVILERSEFTAECH